MGNEVFLSGGKSRVAVNVGEKKNLKYDKADITNSVKWWHSDFSVQTKSKSTE